MADSDRPPPYLLQAEAYPFSTEVRTRYADLDPYKHINNVAVAAIYEEGRAGFLRWMMARGENIERVGRLVAELRIRYLAQILYPNTLQVTAGITHLGRTSFRFSQGLFLDGRCMGICDTVMVHSDGQRPVEISPTWRATFDNAWVRQPASG